MGGREGVTLGMGWEEGRVSHWVWGGKEGECHTGYGMGRRESVRLGMGMGRRGCGIWV